MTRSQDAARDEVAQVRLEPGIEDPDRFYEELLAAHEGLDVEQSFELNARLLMLFANQVGSSSVISECIRLARASRKTAGPEA